MRLLRTAALKTFSSPKRHHNEIKRFRGVVCTNILLNVVNIQVCGFTAGEPHVMDAGEKSTPVQ